MTEPDPLDELGRALFDAARKQRPSREVRERVIAELSKPRAPRFARYYALAVAAVALGALLVLVIVIRSSRREDPAIAISAERVLRGETPSPLVPRPEEPPVTAAPLTPSAPEPRVRHAGVSARKDQESAPAPAQAPPVPASLTDEIAALDRARTALSGGDPGAAIRALDDYEQVLHGTRLTAEATLLRIDALARSGNASAASELASRFVEGNPGSALADRARAFIRLPPGVPGAALRVDGGRGRSQ
jgi:hypothetical protein